jgi:PAS domain S-box-containing protein
MRPPPARASAEIIALYERVAAALSASADLADAQAAKGELAENAGGAGLAERARHAAERGRCIARRLCLRAQADRLFGDPPGWRALFDGHDELEGVLLRRLDEAVIATDLAGTVKLWNAAAERLYGWSCAEVVGRPITEITVGPDDAEVAEQIMASVRSIGSWEGEFWVTRHDGSRFLAYVRDVVVADDDGQPLGLVGISIDLAPGVSDPAATARTVRSRAHVGGFRRDADFAVRSTPA